MYQSWKLGLVTCAFLLSIGCGSGNANLRLVNAMPSQPSLEMLVGGNDEASAVAYATASAYASIGSGSQQVQVEPTGGNNILVTQTINLSSGTNNTFLATTSGGMVLNDDNTTPATGNIAIRAINASATLGTADVYIVASGTNINTVNPTAASVAFPSATDYETVTAGSYQVIFTQPGQKIPMISSSPSVFTSGQVRSIMGLDGQNGGFTTSVLADLN
jgi:uncharacterized protein DUF4397